MPKKWDFLDFSIIEKAFFSDLSYDSHSNSLTKSMKNVLQGQVIAHRGAPLLAPENTLAGMKLAATLQAKWVEFDTQPTGTGEWVVIHDATLERTTNGKGNVIDHPTSYLKSLDAGSWFHSGFSEERIPLLTEVFHLLGKLHVQANIEIKFAKETPSLKKRAHLVDFCCIIKEHWPKNLLPPLISSFDIETLFILKELNPTLFLGMLIDCLTPEALEHLSQLKPFSLHCNYENLPMNILNKLLTLQPLIILLFTVNDKKLATQFFDMGVLAIFSDYPNLLGSEDK